MSERALRTHSRQFNGGVTYTNDHGSIKVSPTGYVYNTYVDPDHRGKGYAQELWDMAVQDADKNQKTLKTNPSEDWIISAFLERRGFQPTDNDLGVSEWAHRPGYIRFPRKEI